MLFYMKKNTPKKINSDLEERKALT